MDSRLHGVPLSATMAAFSNNTFSGIRAPLTLDESDFEYSASPKSRRNSIASSYFSNSEFEYEGFEDEPETKPHVTNQDGEILEKNLLFQEHEFYKSHVMNPDEKLAQESGSVDGISFSGTFGKIPDREFARKNSSVDGKAFLRAFVGSPDEKSPKVISNVNDSDDARSLFSESGDEFVENEEGLENGPTEIANVVKVPVVQKIHIPIAKISRDSDDDSQGSEVSEDEGFLGIVRVPSSEVLRRVNSAPKVPSSEVLRRVNSAPKVPSSEVMRRVNSAPKVRILEVDEGDNDKSQAEKMVETEFVKDLVICDSVSDRKDENEHTDVEDIVKCVVLSDMVRDIGPDVNEEDILHLDEKIQEIDVPDVREKCVDLVVCIDRNLEDNHVLNRNVEHEKLVTESELEIEQMEIKLFSHLEDASSTGNEACQSVFEITRLGQEMTEEAKNSEISITPSDEEILSDHPQEIDCQAVAGSCCGQIINSVSDDGAIKPESVDGLEIFSPEPISSDLGSVFSSARPIIETINEREKNEKLERIKAKYLPLVRRLGRSPEDSIVSNILRLQSKSLPQTFCLDSSLNAMLELEAQTWSDLDFSLRIMVIGKTGVGKSATINSIFGESKAVVSAFEPSTARVKEIIGNIDGIEIKVFDTAGLRTSPADQAINRKILSSIKKIMKKFPPDVILYVDRLDADFSNLNDLPLLKSITSSLSSSIWRKSVIAFTHANSALPDGPDGYPLSYDEFIAQQSRAVQQLIGQSALMNDDDLMIPVSLIENDPFAHGEKWRFNLMFLCCLIKILSELSSVDEIDNRSDLLQMFFRHCFLESYNYCYYDGALVEDNPNCSRSVVSVRISKDKKKFDVRLRSSVLALFPIAKAVFDKVFRQSAEE